MASTKASDGEAKVRASDGQALIRASDGEALIRASDGEAVRDASIDIAERQFLDALMAVEAITEKIKRQEIEALTEVPKAAAHAAAATKHLLTEKHRVYEQQKRHAGIVGDFAIDFDAARDEIGRRLARLRAARGD